MRDGHREDTVPSRQTDSGSFDCEDCEVQGEGEPGAWSAEYETDQAMMLMSGKESQLNSRASLYGLCTKRENEQ